MEIWKIIRGYGGSAIAGTQDLTDFLALEDGKYGKGIINNSKTKIILNLEPDEADTVRDSLKLSDTEYTNNNPSIQGNRTDEKIHDSSTHENTKNTSTTDQSLSQHCDNSIDHIMQLLQEYDTNTRSAT